MHLFWLDIVLEDSYCEVSWVSSRWQDIGDTPTLHFRLPSRWMHEGDALFLVGHLLLACRTLTRQFL